MRYVIYGAGAIGGALGGRLAQHGRDVVLVARGAHLEAVRRDGLRLVSPTDTVSVPVRAEAAVADVGLRDDDVVIVAVKGQDTAEVLDRLAEVAPPGIAVVSAQNGVANERAMLRRFEHVYGMCDMLASSYHQPGEIVIRCTPTSGRFDVGRYPHGTDERAGQIAADLSASSFQSSPDPAIMAWKYRKLVENLVNIIDATCEPAAYASPVTKAAQREAEDVYAAAGIDTVSQAAYDAAKRDADIAPVPGHEVRGGSTWQSLQRGTGSLETDYLNGEIVLLGRLHGVPTPVNAALQRLGADAAAGRVAPRSLTVAQLEERVAAGR